MTAPNLKISWCLIRLFVVLTGYDCSMNNSKLNFPFQMSQTGAADVSEELDV